MYASIRAAGAAWTPAAGEAAAVATWAALKEAAGVSVPAPVPVSVDGRHALLEACAVQQHYCAELRAALHTTVRQARDAAAKEQEVGRALARLSAVLRGYLKLSTVVRPLLSDHHTSHRHGAVVVHDPLSHPSDTHPELYPLSVAAQVRLTAAMVVATGNVPGVPDDGPASASGSDGAGSLREDEEDGEGAEEDGEGAEDDGSASSVRYGEDADDVGDEVGAHAGDSEDDEEGGDGGDDAATPAAAAASVTREEGEAAAADDAQSIAAVAALLGFQFN